MTRISPATLRTKARALSDLIRLELPLGGGIGVIAGQIIALHALPTVFVGLMGFLTAFFVSGAAMISNITLIARSLQSTTLSDRCRPDASRCAN